MLQLIINLGLFGFCLAQPFLSLPSVQSSQAQPLNVTIPILEKPSEVRIASDVEYESLGIVKSSTLKKLALSKNDKEVKITSLDPIKHETLHLILVITDSQKQQNYYKCIIDFNRKDKFFVYDTLVPYQDSVNKLYQKVNKPEIKIFNTNYEQDRNWNDWLLQILVFALLFGNIYQFIKHENLRLIKSVYLGFTNNPKNQGAYKAIKKCLKNDLQLKALNTFRKGLLNQRLSMYQISLILDLFKKYECFDGAVYVLGQSICVNHDLKNDPYTVMTFESIGKDEMQTKLNLSYVYKKLDKLETVKYLLQDVAENGNQAQQDKAKKLMGLWL